MTLTSNEALELLESAKKEVKQDKWILHSICVGNAAGVIAKALQLDEDYAKTLGFIHDIGKMVSYEPNGVFMHEVYGYKFIQSLGYGEEYAGICIKHSFLNHDIDCVATDKEEVNKKDPHYEFVKNYIKNEYTIYDKIINLCDLMCTNKVLTVDKRMLDLLVRHGVYKTTHYHIEQTLQLKEYFDTLLGHNLYDLFPEIKENL